jgi:putative FmdB family regulatory protein
MPIYEYECSHCGNRVEQMQKINDAPLVECPKCGQHELKRLISAPAFQLKGEGWYVTDFRKESKPEKKSSSEE